MPKTIEVENLVFHYHQTEALHRVRFGIERGEVAGLLGPNGAGMFVSPHFGNMGPFVRGVCLSLWMPLAILHLLLLVPCVRFWGLLPGVLFAVFSMALVSFYLFLFLFLVGGFPFSTAFKPSNAQALIMPAGIIPIVFFAAIRWIVFHNTFLVPGAAIILTALAHAIARTSMGKPEENFRASLKLLGLGPPEMFKELD